MVRLGTDSSNGQVRGRFVEWSGTGSANNQGKDGRMSRVRVQTASNDQRRGGGFDGK
jgi:hypothetical protein